MGDATLNNFIIDVFDLEGSVGDEKSYSGNKKSVW